MNKIIQVTLFHEYYYNIIIYKTYIIYIASPYLSGQDRLSNDIIYEVLK